METFWKFVKKHKWVSLCLALALLFPVQIAFLVLRYEPVTSIGYQAMIYYGILFGIVPIPLWYGMYIIVAKIASTTQLNSRQVEFDIYTESASTGIMAASLVAAGIGVMAISICYFADLGFKWYCIITFGYAAFRFIETLFMRPFYRKLKEDGWL